MSVREEFFRQAGLDPADAADLRPGDRVHSRSHSLGSTGTGNEGANPLNQGVEVISFGGRQRPGPREWIVDNVVWKGHATSVFGEGGVAKSLIAMHLGLTVASGQSSWNGFATKTVPVLYLDFELDRDEQLRRAFDLAKGMGLGEIPETFYYLAAAQLPPALAFGVAAEACERLGIGLAIVDSVGFALDGDSETSRDVLSFFRRCIQPLKDAGATPLPVDHQAKIVKGEKYSDKQAFGSVYKTNAVRSSFQIRGKAGQGESIATFTHKKNNLGFKEPDFSLKVTFAKGSITVERLSEAVPNPDHEPFKKERVFAAYEELGRATAEDVAAATDIDLKTVRNATSILVREGALLDTGAKKDRSRICVPRSRTTKATGTSAEQEF